MSSNSWNCPYCGRICTITNEDVKVISSAELIAKDYGWQYGQFTISTCPHPECRKQKISAGIYKYNPQYNSINELLYSWDLLPESQARPFPDYIPVQLRSDYQEACLIKNKSPKASATLSRRCLQGIIRDFWGISKPRLVDEISALQDKVDDSTWKAIDSVRKVGNIGAHMEKDVNLIIDVEAEEAGLLIWLIENLFEEWYIRSHERKAKMEAIKALAESKSAAKSTASSSSN